MFNGKLGLVLKPLLNGESPVAEDMKKYISTPWCSCSNNICKNKCINNGSWSGPCKNCSKTFNLNKIPKQAHGGNLFEHSQWVSLWILMWKSNKGLHNECYLLNKQVVNEFKSYLKLSVNETQCMVLLCAFMHDIGKGGDNITNMYSPNKYDGNGNGTHPKHCKNTILNPNDKYDGKLSRIFKKAVFTPKIIFLLAVTALTHWEFGRTNIPIKYNGITVLQYVKLILSKIYLLEIELSDNSINLNNKILKSIIKLCMLISCGDIAAALPPDTDKISGIKVAKAIYQGDGGGWVKFKFEKHSKTKINAVLKIINDNKRFNSINIRVKKDIHKQTMVADASD
jgi:hypothetical protein